MNNYLQNLFFGIFNHIGIPLEGSAARLSNYSRGLFSFTKVVNENSALLEENAKLTGELAELQKIERENELLRKQLNLSPVTKNQFLLAKIISVTHNSISTIIIDKGSQNGIKKSMAVISSGNIFVGVVEEVFNNYSVVWLTDDPRLSISVRVNNGTEIIGSARGILGDFGKITLDSITNKDPVENGNLVVTSGLDYLPEGLAVAKIESVELKGGSLFKNVKAQIIFNISSGPDLFVILH